MSFGHGVGRVHWRQSALPAGWAPEAGGIKSLLSHREASRGSSCVLSIYRGRTISPHNLVASHHVQLLSHSLFGLGIRVKLSWEPLTWGLLKSCHQCFRFKNKIKLKKIKNKKLPSWLLQSLPALTKGASDPLFHSLTWTSPNGCVLAGQLPPPGGVTQERVREYENLKKRKPRWKLDVNDLISEVTCHHFCHILLC